MLHGKVPQEIGRRVASVDIQNPLQVQSLRQFYEHVISSPSLCNKERESGGLSTPKPSLVEMGRKR